MAKASQLSREDVIHLVGELDDATLAAIVATGASAAEVERAVKRASGEGEGVAKRPLGPRTEAVIDLLAACPTFQKLEPEREG